MRPRHWLLAALLLLGACAHDAPPGRSGASPAATAPLFGTHWQLTKLGDQVIDGADRNLAAVGADQNQRRDALRVGGCEHRGDGRPLAPRSDRGPA